MRDGPSAHVALGGVRVAEEAGIRRMRDGPSAHVALGGVRVAEEAEVLLVLGAHVALGGVRVAEEAFVECGMAPVLGPVVAEEAFVECGVAPVLGPLSRARRSGHGARNAQRPWRWGRPPRKKRTPQAAAKGAQSIDSVCSATLPRRRESAAPPPPRHLHDNDKCPARARAPRQPGLRLSLNSTAAPFRRRRQGGAGGGIRVARLD